MPDKANIFLVGIGGIGMSALARYLLSLQKNVAGYDKVRNANCEALEHLGAIIIYEDNSDLVPTHFRDISETEVIFTPAIPIENQFLSYFRQANFKLSKRAEYLGKISRNHTCLAVAGTHGKTTTSCLLAHLFAEAGSQPTAFLGGIALNYSSNFLSGPEGGIMIAEADEFDRSFHQLKVDGAIVTSTDSDHLDVYETAANLQEAFKGFAAGVDGPLVSHVSTALGGLSYALEENADYQAANVQIEDHRFVFDIISSKHHIKDIRSALPGRHNIENSLAAAALALEFGLKEEQIRSGIESFRGIKRRFEYHIKREDLIYIDDYAHHPAELKAFIGAVRELYPELKITGIFQPHLYSRTRDFGEEFAHELGALDELILMDIYPARERPIPGITANWLLNQVKIENKKILNHEEILNHFKGMGPVVVLTIGAGDIDTLIQPLKLKLSQ